MTVPYTFSNATGNLPLSQLDANFAALGNLTVAIPGGSYKNDFGTSLAVAYFGSQWVKIQNAKNLSYTDEYALIKKTSDSYTNIMVKQNVLAINIAKALQ